MHSRDEGWSLAVDASGQRGGKAEPRLIDALRHGRSRTVRRVRLDASPRVLWEIDAGDELDAFVRVAIERAAKRLRAEQRCLAPADQRVLRAFEARESDARDLAEAARDEAARRVFDALRAIEERKFAARRNRPDLEDAVRDAQRESARAHAAAAFDDALAHALDPRAHHGKVLEDVARALAWITTAEQGGVSLDWDHELERIRGELDAELEARVLALAPPTLPEPTRAPEVEAPPVPKAPPKHARFDTPSGATYDIAGGVAFAAMNQSLRSTMEMGLFDFEEVNPVIDFGALAICLPSPGGGCVSGPVTLRQVLRAMGVPSALLPASSSSLMLRGRADMAPVIAVPLEDDPADSHLAHAHIAHYLVEIVEVTAAGGEVVFLQFAAGLKVGASLATGTQIGEVDFALSTDAAHSVRVDPTIYPAPISFVAAGGSALANYALSRVVKPTIEASIETLHVPGVDDPTVAPNTAFDVSALGFEVRDQRLVVYANIAPN